MLMFSIWNLKMSHFGSPPPLKLSLVIVDYWMRILGCVFIIPPLLFPLIIQNVFAVCVCQRVSCQGVGLQNSVIFRCWHFLWHVRLEVKGFVFKGSEGDSMETADLLPYTNNLLLFYDSSSSSYTPCFLVTLSFVFVCDCEGFNHIHLKGSIKININIKQRRAARVWFNLICLKVSLNMIQICSWSVWFHRS